MTKYNQLFKQQVVNFYNEERIQLKLKGLSTIQYRKQSFK